MRDVVSTYEHVDLIAAPTGELGIELARAHLPQVIIMDVNLPGMSGFEALRVLKNTLETRDIPTIALSAAASERDQQKGIHAGFYRYLTKPVNVDQLVRVLEAIFAELESARAASQG
jgi:CheY-like chemotaxis protein